MQRRSLDQSALGLGQRLRQRRSQSWSKTAVLCQAHDGFRRRGNGSSSIVARRRRVDGEAASCSEQAAQAEDSHGGQPRSVIFRLSFALGAAWCCIVHRGDQISGRSTSTSSYKLVQKITSREMVVSMSSCVVRVVVPLVARRPSSKQSKQALGLHISLPWRRRAQSLGTAASPWRSP